MIRRLIVLPVIVLVVGLPLGAAFAYWMATGSGAGATSVGSGPIVTVQAVANGNSPSAKLLPGGAGDLVVQVENPNDSSVTIVGISQAGPVAVVDGGSGCTSDAGSTLGTSGVSVPTQGSGLNVTIDANATSVVTIPGGAAMAATSASGCQGASFRVSVNLTVQP